MGNFLISPLDLYNAIGRADAPLIIDVCEREDYDSANVLIPGARWRDRTLTGTWANDIEPGARVVAVCVKGLKISQAVTAELRRLGLDAQALQGGLVGWQEAGLPLVRKKHGIGNHEGQPSRWVTRTRPKIDRIACPWLIQRFIDPAAQFFFVEPDQVIAAADKLGAIPYDVQGVALTHRGDGCTFDTLLDEFGLEDRALRELALIVRGADTARSDLSPAAAGLLAVSLGISALAGSDDHGALKRGFPVYDALYAWRRFATQETHNWPAGQK